MKAYFKPALICLFALTVSITAVEAQNRAGGDPKLSETWEPEPQVVIPGNNTSDAPSDAIILFNGKDFSQWTTGNPEKEVGWKIEGNHMTVVGGKGGIRTKESFGDCQLHIEWRSPSEVKGEGQGRGNSGIFLMGRYELQVLDSYKNRTYSNGQAGSIYKQHMPMVNASKAPGEWQTYDIIFTAPRFSETGMLKLPARITVIHNGVLVQNNTVLWGPTEFIGIPAYKQHALKEPISLQDHGNPVSFRNIWIRPL